MRFDVISLFPELFAPFLATGVTRRAFESGQVGVHFSNPRDFSEGNYRRVDDRPFGGGPGMVMMAEPLHRCLAHVRSTRIDVAPVVLFSAAIPGQGGVGHKNEQWPDYWANRFATHGYSVSGALRWRIWNDDRVENWYRQNLLLAAADPGKLPSVVFDTPISVVHPVLWNSRLDG